jgi:hypothetical protein
MAIDLFGLEADEVRKRFPEVYQHVLSTVKPERDSNNRESYRQNWWVFGEPRRELRPALVGLRRYVATVETAKHRIFQFLDVSVLPDNMLVAVATDDGFHLGVLSSHAHIVWTAHSGGTLEDRPRYTKTRCFDPFPFPDANEEHRSRIREIAEELDAHRKRRQEEHPNLTLTDMYNVLEMLRAGMEPDSLDPQERQVFDEGLILILKELHDRLDAAVSAAYGWPVATADEEILARLVALNRERADEEARGRVRWLRPDYQIDRFGSPSEKAEQLEADLVAPADTGRKPAFPSDDMAQTAAVMAALAGSNRPLGANAVAATFRQGLRVEPKVGAVLEALARMGFVLATDDGSRFRLRRAS